jgi:hypothetical protein
MLCANTEGLFRIIQSIPSPKAEPFKRWLAKVGYERIQEIEDPELATKRTRALYQAARDSQSKADAIGATVFDLKAVNPNVVVKLDTRTPQEVIQSIQTQAAIVAHSLQTLQALLSADQPMGPRQ